MSVHLPVVESRRRELETCGYCPKLCRSACPVGEAARSEASIPWGMMTGVWQMGLGRVPLDEEHAELAWTCSGCQGCRTLCDHKNPVADTLLEARADLFRRGLSPTRVDDAVRRHRRRAEDRVAFVRELNGTHSRRHRSQKALLIGCEYITRFPRVAADIVAVAEHCLGPVRVLSECCGAPFLHGGDRESQRAATRRLSAELRRATLYVADPGCARALEVPCELLIGQVQGHLDRQSSPSSVRESKEGEAPIAVRWHDPCQLGRGLGQFEMPRRILERVTGARPLEFREVREQARCSGGGGMLPAFDPSLARSVAELRLAEHRACGGGPLATGCAASLKQFERLGADVVDLFTLVRRAVVGPRSTA